MKRVVSLGGGCNVAFRSLEVDDGDRLKTFYASLSSKSRYLRFFGDQAPPDPVASVYGRIGSPSSAPCLVAVDSSQPDVIVGEALSTIQSSDTAEIALAVRDSHMRRGLARALMEALTEEAARLGIRTLVANVLVENTGMLAFMRSRHAVALSPQELPVLTLAVGTTSSVPDWPDRPGERMLVEGASWLTLSTPELRQLADGGHSLVACPAGSPGGGPRPDCPGLHGQPCPLLDRADRVLCRNPQFFPVSSHRCSWPVMAR